MCVARKRKRKKLKKLSEGITIPQFVNISILHYIRLVHIIFKIANVGEIENF